MPLMSTSTGGFARRSFINGSRLCPPASTLASSCELSKSTASATERGAAYLNAAGIMRGIHLPAIQRRSDGATPSEIRARGHRDASARRVDHTGVEAEPVHAPQVTGVFDFHAAVHHHLEAALFGDTRTFTADHAELQPQRARPDLDGLLGDGRHELRRPENVHHVHLEGNVRQAGVALFAEDLRFVRIDRDYAVAVAL